VGLVRAARRAVGRHLLCAAGHAAAFLPHPRGDRRVAGPAAPDRSDRRRAAPAWRHPADLAHRPAGHRDRARQPGCAAQLRPGRPVLRRGGGAVPGAAGQPQGCGGVLGAVCVRPVVADDDRRHPRGCAALAGWVLRWPGRCPAPAHRGGSPDHGRRARRRRATAAVASGAISGDGDCVPDRRRERGGGLPGQLLLGAARAGRSPGRVPEPAWHGHAGDLLPIRRGAGLPPAGPRWRGHPGAHPGAPRRAGAGGAVGVHDRSALPPQGNHPPGAAARAEAARLLAGLGGEVTVDLARYAELAEAGQ